MRSGESLLLPRPCCSREWDWNAQIRAGAELLFTTPLRPVEAGGPVLGRRTCTKEHWSIRRTPALDYSSLLTTARYGTVPAEARRGLLAPLALPHTSLRFAVLDVTVPPGEARGGLLALRVPASSVPQSSPATTSLQVLPRRCVRPGRSRAVRTRTAFFCLPPPRRPLLFQPI